MSGLILIAKNRSSAFRDKMTLRVILVEQFGRIKRGPKNVRSSQPQNQS